MKNQKGYTLMETMVAVSLGVIAIAAAASTMDSGIFIRTDNRSRLYATNALREELEILRNTAFDTVTGYGANSTFTNAQVTQLVSGAGTRTIANSFGADIRQVTLTVSWRSRRGTTISQSITTLLSRRGLNGT